MVPLLCGVVERVGVAQRGGGAPHAGRVRVIEVLQRVSVLVVRLVLRPARVAGGQKEWSVQVPPRLCKDPEKGARTDFPSF